MTQRLKVFEAEMINYDLKSEVCMKGLKDDLLELKICPPVLETLRCYLFVS